jgi:hypothetical protein
MSTSHLESDDKVGIESADDFQIIRGIGLVIERKLHSAGVSTYAQLASMSPAQLAALFPDFTLLSEDRITRQDWVGQARELAAKYPAMAIVEEEEVKPHNGQHYAVFTVELLLDEMNIVRRTRVMHVQSQKENTWAGWDDRRLIRYFIEKAELPQSFSGAVPSGPRLEMRAVQTPEAMGGAKLSGQLRLKSLEARPSGFERQIMTISQNQPIDIYLTLDLTHVEAALSTPINYAVTVFSKSLNNGLLYSIGEAQGSVEKSDDVKIIIKGSQLPVGTYRLEAIAMISPPADNSREHPSLMAMLEGHILEVY